MSIHREAAETDRHPPTDIIFANAAARLAYTDYEVTDIRNWYLDDDTGLVFELLTITPTFRQITSAGGGSGSFTIEDAATATVTDLITLTHNSTGTPAAGFGTGIKFEAELDAPDMEIGQIDTSWNYVNSNYGVSQFVLRGIYHNGTAYTHERAVLVSPYSSSPLAGDTRGFGAVDLQSMRGNSNEVASGVYATLGGGQENRASGEHATVGGGRGNDALGDFTTISGGRVNIISASDYGVIGGGYGNSMSADRGVIAGGSYNSVLTAYGSIPGGYYGSTKIWGQHVRANGRFAAIGDAQGTIQSVYRKVETHSDATWRELFLDGVVQRYVITSDSLQTFMILMCGMTAGATKSFGYKFEGIIENDGGVTTILASTPTVLYEDDANFDARLVVAGGNALAIEVQDSGGTGDTVRWVATIRTSEVVFA